MAVYAYTARDAQGQNTTGKVTAVDQNAAMEEIRRRRLTVVSVTEDKSGGVERVRGVKDEDVILFTRQMATMIDAGIPIIQVVDSLQEQTQNPSFRKVLVSVRDSIRVGVTLSAAFARHPSVFDNLFVNMIKVGETGGVLSTVLDRLAAYMEKSARLRRKVASAMIYPIVIVSMATIITLVLLVKVVPTFSSIYASFGRELPAMTQTLINVSDAVKNNFILILIGGAAAAGGFTAYRRTEKGAYQIDGTLLRLPVFGELISKVAVSRFCRTLSVLIQSGVPILEGLDIVGRTIGNRVLEKVVQHVIESVREGQSIAEPLGRSKVFPSMVTRMIAVGEQSGQLDKMLVKVADFFDEQVDAAVEGLTSLIEPFIIGFLGIVIGFVVIALFMPILSITQVLS